MAVSVVDLLEPIEIDEQHRRGLAVPAGAAKCVIKQLEQEHPVGEARQGIVEGRFARLI